MLTNIQYVQRSFYETLTKYIFTGNGHLSAHSESQLIVYITFRVIFNSVQLNHLGFFSKKIFGSDIHCSFKYQSTGN